MEQQGLKQPDLVPFIGNKSKVSEVLSRKRPLSLAMIRRLHCGLGIPASVLLQEPGKHLSPVYDGIPLAEMLIPDGLWKTAGMLEGPTEQHARALAIRAHVNAAIVAGRVQYEKKNYAILNRLVGNRLLRKQFPTYFAGEPA